MEHDAPVHKKKKVTKLTKKRKSKIYKSDPENVKILMVLITSQLVKPLTVWMNPNGFLSNLG